MQSAKVRPPAVAGSFYSEDPHRLRAQVESLLADNPAAGVLRHKALIAPHAGYPYSGAVAAAAFAGLRACAREISRVVVIGPAHYVALRGIAVPTFDSFATPLGAVPVDKDALAAIAELPFLQMTLGAFAMVPLLVGDAGPQEVAQTLARLWGGAQTLIVISSDLSHYHDYETAKRLDAATASMIERGDWAQFGSRHACGFLPIAGALIETARHGLSAHRFALCNSGDTAGGRARVVGYGAWGF